MAHTLNELLRELFSPENLAKHAEAMKQLAVRMDHPFSNRDTSTGVCEVCNGVAPQHDTVLIHGEVIPLVPYQCLT